MIFYIISFSSLIGSSQHVSISMLLEKIFEVEKAKSYLFIFKSIYGILPK